MESGNSTEAERRLHASGGLAWLATCSTLPLSTLLPICVPFPNQLPPILQGKVKLEYMF